MGVDPCARIHDRLGLHDVVEQQRLVQGLLACARAFALAEQVSSSHRRVIVILGVQRARALRPTGVGGWCGAPREGRTRPRLPARPFSRDWVDPAAHRPRCRTSSRRCRTTRRRPRRALRRRQHRPPSSRRSRRRRRSPQDRAAVQPLVLARAAMSHVVQNLRHGLHSPRSPGLSASARPSRPHHRPSNLGTLLVLSRLSLALAPQSTAHSSARAARDAAARDEHPSPHSARRRRALAVARAQHSTLRRSEPASRPQAAGRSRPTARCTAHQHRPRRAEADPARCPSAPTARLGQLGPDRPRRRLDSRSACRARAVAERALERSRGGGARARRVGEPGAVCGRAGRGGVVGGRAAARDEWEDEEARRGSLGSSGA